MVDFDDVVVFLMIAIPLFSMFSLVIISNNSISIDPTLGKILIIIFAFSWVSLAGMAMSGDV